jgi:hypothetical protein
MLRKIIFAHYLDRLGENYFLSLPRIFKYLNFGHFLTKYGDI